ncbi:MAG: prephenate dehydrogenase/arogenate dehydrogenase family protein [Chloroflexota bacterium]|nr:MAG: prephenate dehydrogenase/arogenate dehydrogenase family protein [Chloroflexota bacterium]
MQKLLEDVQLSDLHIAIVGLGLMGGSLAMALRGSAGKLTGVDRDPESCRLAKATGVVDDARLSISEGIASADLVILAVPVRSIVTLLNGLPVVRPGGCMVLDLGSTKSEITQAMESLPDQFSTIGGHPMCGREHSGFGAARADLYRDQTFVLCRNRRTTASIENTALNLVRSIGSEPLVMTAERHDRLVAVSSHLPYVLASLLMGRAWEAARLDDRLWQVSASGLRDTTRLAGSEPEMMLEILLANKQAVLEHLEAYGRDLSGFSELLRNGDEAALRDTLQGGQRQRGEYYQRKFGIE